MNIEQLRDYCLAKRGVTEEFPFDETTLVFKVLGKMFALTSLTRLPTAVNLKCDPVRALELRDQYEAVEPGYHMNKKHWNTITLKSDVSSPELRELIDHSYALVVKGMKKADRERLLAL